MADRIQIGKLAGSYKLHRVNRTTNTALCGHKPGGGKTRMGRARSRWMFFKSEYEPPASTCHKCEELLQETE